MQDQEPKIDGRKTRKKVQRSKNPGSVPAASEGLKKKWQDPEFRAKMSQKRPPGYTQRYRQGIPDGMTWEEVEPLIAEAKEKAKYYMDEFEKEGLLKFSGQATSEDEMARQTLQRVFEIIMAPTGNKALVIAASKTLLDHTHTKPATKTDLRLNSAEAWLNEVLEDHKAAQEDGDSKPH